MVKQFGFVHTTQACCGGNFDRSLEGEATRVRTEVAPDVFRLDAIEVDCAQDACLLLSPLPLDNEEQTDEGETADPLEVRLSNIPQRGCKQIRFECASNCSDLTLLFDPAPSEGDAEVVVSHEETGFKLSYDIIVNVMFDHGSFVVKSVVPAGLGSSCL